MPGWISRLHQRQYVSFAVSYSFRLLTMSLVCTVWNLVDFILIVVSVAQAVIFERTHSTVVQELIILRAVHLFRLVTQLKSMREFYVLLSCLGVCSQP